MSPEERREILQHNYINETDIFRFRWRITQVLCEVPERWGALTDVDLITKARLLGYKKIKYKISYLKMLSKCIECDHLLTSLAFQ